MHLAGRGNRRKPCRRQEYPVQLMATEYGLEPMETGARFEKLTLPFRESCSSSIATQNRASLVQEQDIGEARELLRAWIVQEAAVAQRVVLMCGQDVMEWDNIASTIKYASLRRNGVTRAFGIAINEKNSFPDDIYHIISSFRRNGLAKRGH